MTQEAHTPEPWETTERHGYFEILADYPNSDWYERKGKHAVAYADTDCENAEANARRIVACVNALAGISTEAIESGVFAELVAVVRDTRLFNEGVGFYNFSRLPDDERANASYDAWQQIAERMDAILAKLEASK